MTAIRQATVEDRPAVASLLVELGRDVSAWPVHNPSFEIRFGRHLALRDPRTVVASDAGTLVCLLDMEFRQRLRHPRPQPWVHDLVVTESMRGRGGGSALLAEAATLAVKRGCFRGSLETANWRERTHSFYMSAGWTDGTWFVKLLDPSWGAAGYDG